MSCCNGKNVFVRGVTGVAKAVLRIDRAAAETVAERRDQCRGCPHSIKHPFKRTRGGLPLVSFCRLCKCALHLKTMNAGESCPDDPPRWKAVEKLAGKNPHESAEPLIL